MLHSFKSILGAGLLALTGLSAQAFSLIGPFESYQTLELGYARTGLSSPEMVDRGGPKNLGEGYRWNIPVLYYSVDQNFLDYFGSNGLAQIQAAFDAFNALPAASAMSSNLTEFPLEASRVNYRAQALQLYDLKSETMYLITEQVGLASPDRWTWCLRLRYLQEGQSCPNYSYLVIKRNFDPVTQNYSSYVNGTLYTYHIEEHCNVPNNTIEWMSDAIEDPVDPLAFQNTAIASHSVAIGFYFTGWTRDDLGGLRYLLSTTALPNTEPMPPGVQQITTNSVNQFLITQSFADLNRDSLTNDPGTFRSLHPDIVITGTTNYITNFFNTNITTYTTNYPLAPVGTPPTTVSVTNVTPYAATAFAYAYGNLVTNHFFPTTPVTIQTVLQTNNPHAPVGTSITNTVTTTTFANTPSGDYYLLPQGSSNGCDLSILYTQTTNVVVTTNVLDLVSNSPASTNVLAQFQLISFTNYSLVYNLVQCPDGGVALRRGINKVTFVRRDFDSLLGQFFIPVTNAFSTREVQNNTEVGRSYRRIVQQPDFLVSAADLASGKFHPQYNRSRPIFVSATNAYPGLAGPGILQSSPRLMFTFDKGGDTLVNTFNPSVGSSTLTEAGATEQFHWGSFDGTTNEPVVYPSTLSIRSLEDQLILRVANPAVPAGKVGTAFSYLLQGGGGQAPYSWAFVPNQFGLPSGLPPGLTLQSGGQITGTPTTAGSFTFVVRMTDAGSRAVEQPLTITVNP
jgi:hypothetical protein